MDKTRYNKILGLDNYQPNTRAVCFLPWISEFGWYIMNHVKRFHAYNHPVKIACIKRGHESLFPTAKSFFYDWESKLPDNKKGGVVVNKQLEEEIIEKIKLIYGDDVTFISPGETSWEEKKTLAKHTFIPEPIHRLGLKTDCVLIPRYRELGQDRNYQHWQTIINKITKFKFTVGLIGAKHASYNKLSGAKIKSWDYIDVDSDVELILNTKIVIGQESGLSYLTYMCEKPIVILDHCHIDIANLHRNHNVGFSWMAKKSHGQIADAIINYLKKHSK